ncbi:MAG: BlaI/MecI/CopY family transcriptional regulator [Verrucomicrobia bacterium]|nr:BlaI/MecI/CopY family transcriptional regulator [Verrucomicrobiota bacterium]
MPAKSDPPKPTEGELAILRCLWRHGPGTVRDVVLRLRPQPGYTTALKMMQIMTEKGLLERDTSQRVHVFTPRVPRAQTQKQLVADLLHKAFDGSASSLVLQALSNTRASKQELEAVRKLLNSIEGNPQHE